MINFLFIISMVKVLNRYLLDFIQSQEIKEIIPNKSKVEHSFPEKSVITWKNLVVLSA